MLVLSLASSMAHVLVYTWLLKADALLRGSGGGCCSMLKTLVDLGPAAEQQDHGDERPASKAVDDVLHQCSISVEHSADAAAALPSATSDVPLLLKPDVP